MRCDGRCAASVSTYVQGTADMRDECMAKVFVGRVAECPEVSLLPSGAVVALLLCTKPGLYSLGGTAHARASRVQQAASHLT